MATIKDYVQVIINSVPRLSADVYGNEWPVHDHDAHNGLDDDDHLQYMLCSAGVDRPFTGDVYFEEDCRIVAESALEFDDHYRYLHTDGGGDWDQDHIKLSASAGEWQTFYDTFGEVSILAALIAASAGQTSLDIAYDYTGSGAGSDITADSGAVSITVPLDADNSALYLESSWTGAPPSTYDNPVLYINKEIYSSTTPWADRTSSSPRPSTPRSRM